MLEVLQNYTGFRPLESTPTLALYHPIIIYIFFYRICGITIEHENEPTDGDASVIM